MKPVILYRESEMPKEEIIAADKAGFRLFKSRTEIKPGDMVVARFSALPFYKELEEDIDYLGGKLVNSHIEHVYVADLKNWVSDLGQLTPKTWYRLEDVPKNEGPFILKGATNSKKTHWSTHMYAKDWDSACRVHSNLQDDGFISTQPVYIRQYVPLVQYGTTIGGMPLTKEFRFFVYRKQILCGGFYWDAFHDDIIENGFEIPNHNDVPLSFLNKAIDIIGNKIPFYTIDVAQTQNGDYIVIELNDGQMSGRSANQADELYLKLFEAMGKISIQISVNRTSVEWTSHMISYEQVVFLATGKNYEGMTVIYYYKDPITKASIDGILTPGKFIAVYPGTRFNIAWTGNS